MSRVLTIAHNRTCEQPLIPCAPGLSAQLNPIVAVLIGYLERSPVPDALDRAVKAAYRKTPEFLKAFNITNANSFLRFADDLLRWIPHKGSEGRDIYNVICMFYFVFNQDPLVELQTPIIPNAVDRPLAWLSSWLVVYSQLIGLWMDTPDSLTEESLESFKRAKHYNIDEAQPPKGGWKTFNDFFSRRLKHGTRPIDSPDDDTVIVYPSDSKFDTSVADHMAEISSTGTMVIKGLPWSIDSLLQGSEYADDFHGGIWMHVFLNTFNYHRQHAPVAGKVLEAKVIQGSVFVEIDSDGNPSRPEIPDQGGFPNISKHAGSHARLCISSLSLVHHTQLTSSTEFLQTRGVIIVDNPTVGKVAVLPIGMALVAGVKLLVSKGQMLPHCLLRLGGKSNLRCGIEDDKGHVESGITKDSEVKVGLWLDRTGTNVSVFDYRGVVQLAARNSDVGVDSGVGDIAGVNLLVNIAKVVRTRHLLNQYLSWYSGLQWERKNVR
ncbi:hypothetical protein M426DRAFT_264256 [Hypoxylon sp. CI-4A]|nr:hypothetical protein M426DRAFT_264256 [Hypoxylon sp. CI-4A]